MADWKSVGEIIAEKMEKMKEDAENKEKAVEAYEKAKEEAKKKDS